MENPLADPTKDPIGQFARSEQMDTSALTVEEYLRGMVAYEVADNALAAILLKRGLDAQLPAYALLAGYGEEISDGQKSIDLATADLYMWCAAAPSSKHDTEDADGGWKHKGGGWQSTAADKRELRRMARELYQKWGEASGASSTVRIVNL